MALEGLGHPARRSLRALPLHAMKLMSPLQLLPCAHGMTHSTVIKSTASILQG